MDRREGRSIPNAQKINLRRTSAPYAKTGAAIRTGSRRVKLRHRRDAKSKGRTQSLASGGILLHNPLGNREKLQHLRQGIVGSSKVASALENIPCRSTPSNHHSHGVRT